MKTQLFLLAVLCAFLFTSCEKSETITSQSDVSAMSREKQFNMVVTITKTDNSVVTATVTKASATYVSSSYFTATLNPGTGNSQSYNATAMTFSEPDTKLKITKSSNGGVGVIYEDKSTANISIGSGVLNLSIQPGNISTTATSIVGDENDIF